MRIAIVKWGHVGGGGVRRVIESWARMLAAHCHRVVVVSQASSKARPLPRIEGVEERFYEPSAAVGRLGSLRAVRQAAIGVLDGVGQTAPLDLVVTHDAVMSPAVRALLPEVPLLQTFHSPSVDENRLNNWKYAPNLWRRLTYPATLGMLWHADRAALRSISWAHTLSDFTWQLLSARYPALCRDLAWSRVPGTFEDQRFVLPPDRAAVRRRLGLADDELILLTVRRLVPRNAVDRILDCAARMRLTHPRARFLIGGTGVIESQLEERAVREGLGDVVRFLGFIDEQDLPAYYQAADAFLLPTRDLECFGLPVVEAMACGCTPLVTPVGAPAEICAAEHRELVAAENSSRAFGDLVERFADGAIARRGAELAAEARRRFSEQAVSGMVVELVERVRDAARGPR